MSTRESYQPFSGYFIAIALTALLGSSSAFAQDVSGPISIEIGPDTFAALSWEFEVMRPIESGSGRTSAKPEISTLRVTRRMGEGTGTLLASAFQGQAIKEVALMQGDLTIRLEKVLVEAFAVQGASFGNEQAAEIVEFNFTKIRVFFGDDQIAGWDVESNTGA